jgi:hypothetical protein
MNTICSFLLLPQTLLMDTSVESVKTHTPLDFELIQPLVLEANIAIMVEFVHLFGIEAHSWYQRDHILVR